MPIRCRVPLVVISCLALTACSPTRSAWELSQLAIAAMGGARNIQAIETLTLSGGEGLRNRLGQLFDADSQDAPGTLSDVVTTLDFAGRRAAYVYDIALASGFMQHRSEVLTRHDGRPVGYSINNNGRMASTPGGLFSWGPQNTPATALVRNPLTLLLEAALSGTGGDPAQEVEFNGNPRLYSRFTTSWGEDIGLYFDPQSNLLVGFETLDTEPMLGDVEARYVLGNYQAVGDVLLPHRLTVTKGGLPFSDVRYESIAINSADADAVFTVPEDLLDQAAQAVLQDEYVPLAWNEVSNGVFHVVAYSHHSMVVEFPSFVAVIEAPYTETQSLALVALIEEQIPDKPIRYVAITHPHWDHTGGVRGIASVGATILVAAGHERQMRPVIREPRTNPPDALQQARNMGATTSVEIFEDSWSIADGPQSLELYEVSGSPHAEPYVLAYLPASATLFQSDLFIPGSGVGTPASAHLRDAIRELGLNVRTLVGGHGGAGPFSELVAANN